LEPRGPAANDGRKRLLATDDRREALRLIDRTLGDRFECEFAGDVAEAREKLGGGDFDLAMCDIQMPGESGLVLAEEITGTRPEIAVVLVTGIDDPEVARKALEFGVSGYLVKPFWPGQLLITAMTASAATRSPTGWHTKSPGSHRTSWSVRPTPTS
jgi:cyclic di-GMP phosphodiesterase